ncbi:hypothetical protein QL285_015561 [Trifolium repens]|nr:hypothetical protein QL285_015561 [Trifolium repens]
MRAVHMIGEWRAVNTAQRTTAVNTAATAAIGSAIADQNSDREALGVQLLRWQKPREGWWKCNVDASFSQSPNHAAGGWCMRDSLGGFVAAGTKNFQHAVTVNEGEALAHMEAMHQAISRGWSNIVFESDSKIVVDAVHSNHHGNSEWSSLISSIKLLLHCNMNFEVKFTKRQANMAAHTLARAACFWTSRTFFNHVPHCIEPLITNEMS